MIIYISFAKLFNGASKVSNSLDYKKIAAAAKQKALLYTKMDAKYDVIEFPSLFEHLNPHLQDIFKNPNIETLSRSICPDLVERKQWAVNAIPMLRILTTNILKIDLFLHNHFPNKHYQFDQYGMLTLNVEKVSVNMHELPLQMNGVEYSAFKIFSIASSYLKQFYESDDHSEVMQNQPLGLLMHYYYFFSVELVKQTDVFKITYGHPIASKLQNSIQNMNKYIDAKSYS